MSALANNILTRPMLLVEDNPMHVDLTLQAFKKNDFTHPIVVCRDGEEALIYIEQHSCPTDPELPILVVLDLRLPKIDGVDVLKQARQNPVWKEIPFVVLTTSKQSSDAEATYRLGANSYISKPVGSITLVEMVKKILNYAQKS
ncbi:response regulator [Leptolyngbya sp. FACHB-261]|uniref:response regulator n=1 Tax=Leptolyngbya sp. FACHB-261 TaxID=2692806 RepID=UPI0016869F7C|nr:response regulator [Leptolyngbya sp. FACHB-261]MBD2102382.1 response regulator [Leptolyngbya sp. FACHB-261]